MKDETVYVEFASPRSISFTGSSISLEGFGGSIILPKKLTQVRTDEEGLAIGITIPQWLARDRGLESESITGSESTFEQEHCEMKRDDWFLLGSMMAMLIRGESINDAVWNACKAVNKLNTVYKE